ncbi:hypothetical protein EJ04DRAFT_498598 [Polyplosphaeria fusca]|uniref:AB hydrolase-1 domain-containing protein n=1 Tax=Polyplosphaeria fusca TaxID=682080 RepID=A0A9P4QRV8_9PLEO|nr:hypothetical protein EJ04DRAFT_498598 [Polyplosphaeria fusca]
MVYNFTAINPSPEIVWTPCFDNFTCALLEVPLDYSNTSAGTVDIAFLKYWSDNPDAEDVLLNPGGPGGSGVNMLLDDGLESLQAVLGTQFNLVGFDPRGVNNSGININCFTGSPSARDAYIGNTLVPFDNSTEYGMAEAYQKLGAFGELCTAADAKLNGGTAKYAGTVAVAQDMLHYVELLAESKGCAKEEAKINYYGISYGTVLGATFATLFPDRLARFILDGNVDTEDYYLSGSENGIYDTDAAGHSFFAYCFEAGPQLCAFHQNATSADDLEARYRAIMKALKKSPIVVPSSDALVPPTLYTWNSLSAQVLNWLYGPFDTFPIMDLALTGLETGNTTFLASLLEGTPQNYSTGIPQRMISCIDQAGRNNLTDFDKFTDQVDLFLNRSFYGGPVFAESWSTPCRSLNIIPPKSQLFEGERYILLSKLPVLTSNPGVPGANKTGASILFIGNTRDPVTSLRGAKKLHGLFADSGLLTLNATGVSYLANGVRRCYTNN